MTKTILVADQDPSVRRMLARVLETAGYAAILSGSGPETVFAIRNQRPDLLLLEIHSPDAEGWQALEQVRRTAPQLPVILITGWPNLVAQAAQRGIECLMEKPLDLPELLNQIQRLITEQPARAGRQNVADAEVESAFGAGLTLASAVRH